MIDLHVLALLLVGRSSKGTSEVSGHATVWNTKVALLRPAALEQNPPPCTSQLNTMYNWTEERGNPARVEEPTTQPTVLLPSGTRFAFPISPALYLAPTSRIESRPDTAPFVVATVAGTTPQQSR